jgi:RNA polymerase sigma-70 factor (ECF subfamily)
MECSSASNVPGHQGSLFEEAEVIRRCQQGETAAFDELVLRYQRQAFAVAWRLLGDFSEAKDVTQEAFVRAYQGVRTFRGEAKFSTWLLSIVMNLCRNRRRWWARRKRLIAASLDDPVDTEEGSLAHQVADPSPTQADAAMSAELKQQVMAALML